MTVIKIDSEFSLQNKGDSYVLIHTAVRKKGGKPTEKKHYVPSLKAAVKRYIQLSTVQCTTLFELYDVYNRISNETTAKIKKIL